MNRTSNTDSVTSESLTEQHLSRIYVVIPALNEERSIGLVLTDLPDVRRVFVIDNGSADSTASVASQHGADVVHEPQRGYGKACLVGIEHVNESVKDSEVSPDDAVLVFVDADYSDQPEELASLAWPILNSEFDFIIGSRSSGKRESGAMPVQAIFGNWLACSLMQLFWGTRFTDLGPFRAIRLSSLNELKMVDENFGWTIEMQIKAVQHKLRTKEIPVSYRRRVGVSKISGTISGTLKAGYKIIYTIFRLKV